MAKLFNKKKDPTIEDAINTMNDNQKKVLYYLMDVAYEDGKNGRNEEYYNYSDRFAELGFNGYAAISRRTSE